MTQKLKNTEIKRKLNLKNDIIFKTFFSRKGNGKYISETVTVLEKHRDYKVNSILKTYYIELPKFREADVDMNEKQNQWLAFIDDMDRGKIEMAEEKNKIIKDAKIEMNYLTGEEEVRRLAELMDKWESDRASELSYATSNGIKRGIKEGRKEEKIEIAKKLLETKMEINEISRITGLSIEEISNIKNK